MRSRIRRLSVSTLLSPGPRKPQPLSSYKSPVARGPRVKRYSNIANSTWLTGLSSGARREIEGRKGNTTHGAEPQPQYQPQHQHQHNQQYKRTCSCPSRDCACCANISRMTAVRSSTLTSAPPAAANASSKLRCHRDNNDEKRYFAMMRQTARSWWCWWW